MTRRRPSERDLFQRLDDLDGDGADDLAFVRQVIAVIEGERDSVDAPVPDDADDDLSLVIQAAERADVSLIDAWQAVDAAGADPPPLADFTQADGGDSQT